MAMTHSEMLPLSHTAPSFSLQSTEGHLVSSSDFQGQPMVVMFICNHCPYVIHIAPALKKLTDEYVAKGVAFIAINSNDTEAYPADNFENMKKEKASRGYKFPYLLDDTQEIAKAYQAACTPDIYVFNASHDLAYRGQFDSSRPHRISSGNYDSNMTPASGESLAAALDLVIAGKAYEEAQYPSLGCNIKWKPGNEPEYFR